MDMGEIMVDMEENLDAAVHIFEEFGRMGAISRMSKKGSKKYAHSQPVAAPTPKSVSSYRSSKKSSKRS